MAFFGICYSPYHHANPPPDPTVTQLDVEKDMLLIKEAKYKHIRTYGIDGGNQWNVELALRHDINYLGLGVWVFPGDRQRTLDHIGMAMRQVKQAYDDVGREFKCDLVIGNEVDRADVSPAVILSSMEEARGERDALARETQTPFLKTVRVTTCMTVNALSRDHFRDWLPVVKECDEVVYVTVYPYLDLHGPPPDPRNIDKQMTWAWTECLIRATETEAEKDVVIAEIGWPTHDTKYPNSATLDNQRLNYNATKEWVSNNPPNAANRAFDTFWFEMFDEPWKTNEPAERGPHWGLYYKDSKKKW